MGQRKPQATSQAAASLSAPEGLWQFEIVV
jgi:hypothetical protein